MEDQDNFVYLNVENFMKFATEPGNKDMTIFEFVKQLQSGKTDSKFIQELLDEKEDVIDG